MGNEDLKSMNTFLSTFDMLEANIGVEHGVKHSYGLGSVTHPSMASVPARSSSLPRPQTAFGSNVPSKRDASLGALGSAPSVLAPTLTPWDRLPPRRTGLGFADAADPRLGFGFS